MLIGRFNVVIVCIIFSIDVVLFMLYFILFMFLLGFNEILFELKVRFLFISINGC